MPAPSIACMKMKTLKEHCDNWRDVINIPFIRQIGPLKWLHRYARRQFEKRILRRDSRLKLPTGLTINLPRWSRSATEVYVTNADMDWGAEALFANLPIHTGISWMLARTSDTTPCTSLLLSARLLHLSPTPVTSKVWR